MIVLFVKITYNDLLTNVASTITYYWTGIINNKIINYKHNKIFKILNQQNNSQLFVDLSINKRPMNSVNSFHTHQNTTISSLEIIM